MLEYDRIDISEGIDTNKCKYISKKCNLCKLYYFLDKKSHRLWTISMGRLL